MSLDKIPMVEWDVIETHYEDRRRSAEEFQRLKSEIEEALRENRALGYLIRLLAGKYEDPTPVYETAYTLLDVINAQSEIDELNRQRKLKGRGEK